MAGPGLGLVADSHFTKETASFGMSSCTPLILFLIELYGSDEHGRHRVRVIDMLSIADIANFLFL